MLSRRRLGSGVLVGLVLLVVGVFAIATDPTPTGVDQAELQDLAVLADQKEISIKDVVKGYGWRNDLSEVIWEISQTFPDDFADSRKPSTDRAWISFSGEVPQGARDMVNAFTDDHTGVTVDLVPNAGYTERELQTAVQTVHYAVMGHEDVVDAVTVFDLDTRTIDVEVALKDTEADSVVEDLESLAEAALVPATRADILDTFSVSVENTGAITKLDSSYQHWGGEKLTTCTSGFATEESGRHSRQWYTAPHRPVSYPGCSIAT